MGSQSKTDGASLGDRIGLALLLVVLVVATAPWMLAAAGETGAARRSLA